MRPVALTVALLIALIGVIALFAPASLVTIAQAAVTPKGLFVVAAVRVAIGLVLIGAAPGSRAPRTLRVLGAFLVIAGLATPLFGVGRARAVVDWELAQGTSLLRLVGVVALVLGGFLTYAVSPRPRTP